MTDIATEASVAQVSQSKVQIDQLNSNIKNINAQLEAHKQMLNEQLQQNINFRTHIQLLQTEYNTAVSQNTALTAKNKELENKVTNEAPQAPAVH